MTNRQNRKIRLVKCPKCARILPEPEQVPLYTCGGCSTILQAKSYKIQKETSESTLRTEDVVRSNGSGHACNIQESSSPRERSSSAIDQSSTQNEQNGDKAADFGISDKIGAENYALHTSLPEESNPFKITSSRQVIDSRGELCEALDIKLNQNDNIGAENQDRKHIRKANYAKSATRKDFEALQNIELVTEKLESVIISSEIAKDRNGNSFEKAGEAPGQKIENFDEVGFLESRVRRSTYKPKILKSDLPLKSVGNSVKVIPQCLPKRSLPYDGNMDHVLGQPGYSSGENDISEHNKTWQHKNDRLPPWRPRIRDKVAFETGSSDSYAYAGPPCPRTRDHPYEKTQYMERRGFSEATCRDRGILPMYYNDETSREIFQKQNYYSGNLPQTRYTEELDNERFHICGRFIHRHPDDRRWSAQLPSGPQQAPPARYYRHRPMPNVDHHFRETSWDLYEHDQYPKSPLGFSSLSSCGRPHNTSYVSDGRQRREQPRAMIKRHIRPIAGGAPFITCHFCFRVIQLPEEFILSKQRKKHRLKCGACSKVLEFSLENETYLVPRVPHVGDRKHGVATNLERNISSLSSSQVNLENVSILESKEASKIGKELNKQNSSGALAREKRKDEIASLSYRSRQIFKVSRQRSSRSKSPLHRLMGYASPEDLLKGRTAEARPDS